VVGGAKQHGSQPHHRPDRQINPAAHDHWRQRNREQAELDAQANDFKEIAEREEILRDGGKETNLCAERQQQDPFARRERSSHACRHQAGLDAATAA
jgi:hypothetical protein